MMLKTETFTPQKMLKLTQFLTPSERSWLGEQLKQPSYETVAYWNESVLIEKAGQPIVVILPFQEYQDYLKYTQRQQRFSQLKQVATQNSTFANLNEDEALALVEQEREAIYQLSHLKQ